MHELDGNIDKFQKKFMVDYNKDEDNSQDKRRLFIKKTNGLYTFLTEIPPDRYLIYLFLFFVFYNALSFLNITPTNFIVFLVSLFLIYLYYDKDRNINLTEMQMIEIKLNSIKPEPKYFYLDVGIIEVFSSIQGLREYNVNTYDEIIYHVDDFLKLYYEVFNNEMKSYHKTYDILKDLKLKILNDMHSLVFSLDNELLLDKLKTSTDSLHIILNFYVNQIKLKNNKDIKDNGITYYKREINFNDGNVLPYKETSIHQLY